MDTAWIAFPEDLFRKSFKCCEIFHELDGSEVKLFNSALTRALSVAVESDYVSDYETNVYYSEDDNMDKTVFCKSQCSKTVSFERMMFSVKFCNKNAKQRQLKKIKIFWLRAPPARMRAPHQFSQSWVKSPRGP